MKHETRIPRIRTNFPKSYEFVIIGVIRVLLSDSCNSCRDLMWFVTIRVIRVPSAFQIREQLV